MVDKKRKQQQDRQRNIQKVAVPDQKKDKDQDSGATTEDPQKAEKKEKAQGDSVANSQESKTETGETNGQDNNSSGTTANTDAASGDQLTAAPQPATTEEPPAAEKPEGFFSKLKGGPRRWLNIEEGAQYNPFTGKKMYPALIDGNVRYLPKFSDATDTELLQGLFIKEPGKSTSTGEEGYDIFDISTLRDGPEKKDKVPVPKWDKESGRMLYPLETTDDEVIYVPKKSEATEEEIEANKFREDEAVSDLLTDEDIAEAKRRAEEGTDNQDTDDKAEEDQDTEAADSDDETTNTKTEDDVANDPQPSPGFQPVPNGKPIRDTETNRLLYPASTGEEEISVVYVPLESQATETEKATRQFLPDASVATEKAANPRGTNIPQERLDGKTDRAARLERQTNV